MTRAGAETPPPHTNKASVPQVSKAWRNATMVLAVVVIGLVIALFAVINPFGAGTPQVAGQSPRPATASPSPSPSSTRQPFQFPAVSESPLPGSQQCPDAGSVGAGDSDIKTEVLEIKGQRDTDVRLLGPNRRVVVADNATMTGSITMCGDGGTILIIGTLRGSVLMQGTGVKIVVQDGGTEKLPTAYSTTNGRVFRCSTNKSDRTTPQCADFVPRPSAKPNG